MSNSATFEFRTILGIEEVKQNVSALWHGLGYTPDVYMWPSMNGCMLCTLDYAWGKPKEQAMMIAVLEYIHRISVSKDTYYYRCVDFIGNSTPVADKELTAGDLFTPSFAPSIGASREEKYRISR